MIDQWTLAGVMKPWLYRCRSTTFAEFRKSAAPTSSPSRQVAIASEPLS